MNQPVPIPRKMVSEIMKVTPDLATKWLEGNVHNREVRDSVVKRYADDMKAGRWGLTHQGIAFDSGPDDPKKRLLDGQHRLFAILDAKVPVYLMVSYFVPEESQQFLDGGIPRSAVDVMRLANPDANVTNFRMAVARYMLIGTRAQVIMSRQELIEFYEQHSKVISFVVEEAFQSRKVLRVNPGPVAAVMGRASYHEDHDRIKEFGRILLDGLVKDPDRDSSVILLRNWLLQGCPSYDASQRISKSTIQYMKTQRALVAFLQGEKIKSLYLQREEQWALPGETRRKKQSK